MFNVMDVVNMELPLVGVEVRESRLSRLRNYFREVKAATDRHGLLVPLALVPGFMGISKQAVFSLIERGKLARVELHGHMYITEASLTDYAREERKMGRPTRIETITKREMLSVAFGKDTGPKDIN